MSGQRFWRMPGGVCSLGSHLVWCPKYRRRVLGGRVARRLDELIEAIAAEHGWQIVVYEVMPDHVHQRCRKCGHMCKGNRKSQAVFCCLSCTWTGNADTNAAINVREEALTRWAARTEQLAGTSGEKPGGVAVSQAGSKSKTGPLTGPATGPAASAMNRKPPNAA